MVAVFVWVSCGLLQGNIFLPTKFSMKYQVLAKMVISDNSETQLLASTSGESRGPVFNSISPTDLSARLCDLKIKLVASLGFQNYLRVFAG